MDLLNPIEKAQAVAQKLPQEMLKQGKKMRSLALLNGALVATTVISGAFVAGNDAGRAYNTFPKMGDEWIPSTIFEMETTWKNFFENTATVQFDHRVLAISTLTSIAAMYTMARKSLDGEFWKVIPRYSRVGFTATAHMSVLQVGLGISTLLLYVPIPLAAVHQAGSLVLLTCITGLAHSLRFASVSRGFAAAAPVVTATVLK